MASLAIVPVRTIGNTNFGFRAAIVLGTVLAIAPKPVLAEVQVRGSPEAVRIEVRDAQVEEILAALSRTFGVHYQLSTNLDKQLSGTYTGALPRVVTRILDGYNFVLKTDNGSITVTVLGTPDAARAVLEPSSAKVVRVPAAAAAQPPRVVDDRARPAASASTAAPSPAIELAEGSSFPAPAVSTSRDAPAPVPQLGQSGAPAPAPPALGSAAAPAPQPGSFAGTPPPVAGPTPLLVPPRAQ